MLRDIKDQLDSNSALQIPVIDLLATTGGAGESFWIS